MQEFLLAHDSWERFLILCLCTSDIRSFSRRRKRQLWLLMETRKRRAQICWHSMTGPKRSGSLERPRWVNFDVFLHNCAYLYLFFSINGKITGCEILMVGTFSLVLCLMALTCDNLWSLGVPKGIFGTEAGEAERWSAKQSWTDHTSLSSEIYSKVCVFLAQITLNCIWYTFQNKVWYPWILTSQPLLQNTRITYITSFGVVLQLLEQKRKLLFYLRHIYMQIACVYIVR